MSDFRYALRDRADAAGFSTQGLAEAADLTKKEIREIYRHFEPNEQQIYRLSTVLGAFVFRSCSRCDYGSWGCGGFAISGAGHLVCDTCLPFERDAMLGAPALARKRQIMAENRADFEQMKAEDLPSDRSDLDRAGFANVYGSQGKMLRAVTGER